MTFAVIPAAGHSRRMGRPKLSLPLGARTILERVIDAIRAAKIEHTIVVLAPHVAELEALAQSAGAETLLLPEATPDMRTTVLEGLSWLEAQCHPAQDADWLLVPADHPTLDAAIIRALLNARIDDPARSIFVPTYQGKRGHPTLIRWKHV